MQRGVGVAEGVVEADGEVRTVGDLFGELVGPADRVGVGGETVGVAVGTLVGVTEPRGVGERVGEAANAAPISEHPMERARRSAVMGSDRKISEMYFTARMKLPKRLGNLLPAGISLINEEA